MICVDRSSSYPEGQKQVFENHFEKIAYGDVRVLEKHSMLLSMDPNSITFSPCVSKVTKRP